MIKKSFIEKTRIDQLYLNLPYAVMASLFVSFLILMVLTLNSAWNPVFLVFLINWLVGVLRFISIYLVKKKYVDKYSKSGRVLYVLGLLFSSLSWAAVSVTVFPIVDSSFYLFFIILLLGVAMGGLINLTAHFYYSMLHLQILMIPIIVTAPQYLNSLFLHCTFVLILYDLFLIFLSHGLYRQINQTIQLKYENFQTVEQLKYSELRFETIFKEAPAGIFYYDTNLILQNCNQSLSNLLQVPMQNLIGYDLKQLKDQRVLPALAIVLQNEKGFYDGPYHSMMSDIDIICSLKSSAVKDVDGEVIGGVCILEDNTEKEGILNRIEHQAYHDALTDLPNRQLLLDRLEQAMIGSHRNDSMGAVLFLDLDKFKLVNDSMGHRIGDLLLQHVALSLKTLLRDEDTVARLGGDEFVILLPLLTGTPDEIVHKATLVAQKIHSSLERSITIENFVIQTSTSIGVYVFSSEDKSTEFILKSADTAMYHSKDTGRKKTSFYHPSMEESMMRQLMLEQELKLALNQGDLDMYYQPIVKLKDQKIVAAEALLRWNHKEHGFISPEDIITTAESSGQILALGDWILNRVLEDYSRWIREGSASLDYVSINISIKQIQQDQFVDNVIRKIKEKEIPCEKIVLEITESILISDFKNTVRKIKDLQTFGIQFALDDFGTGYSSLSYLKRLPLNKLKIDRFFTRNLLTDHDDYVLVKTILSIAMYFNLDVIVEGVEEECQADKLESMGCTYYQGYFCSKPVPEDEFLQLL